MQPRSSHQTPVIGHVGDDQGKTEDIAEIFFMLICANLTALFSNQQYQADHQDYGSKMRRCEQRKFLLRTLPEKIAKEVFHEYLQCRMSVHLFNNVFCMQAAIKLVYMAL